MKTLDDATHIAICKAVSGLRAGRDRPDEWFIFRYLAHALNTEGAAREYYLTEFSDYLESYLKQAS